MPPPPERGSEPDALSYHELEDILFLEEERAPKGPLNLPTVAGLFLACVGLLYLLQLTGLQGPSFLSAMTPLLPWLAGILIVFAGFGVFRRRPIKSPSRRIPATSTADRGAVSEDAAARDRSVVSPIAANAGLHRPRRRVPPDGS